MLRARLSAPTRRWASARTVVLIAPWAWIAGMGSAVMRGNVRRTTRARKAEGSMPAETCARQWARIERPSGVSPKRKSCLNPQRPITSSDAAADQSMRSTSTLPPPPPPDFSSPTAVFSAMWALSLVWRVDAMLQISSFMLRTLSRENAGATIARIRRCSTYVLSDMDRCNDNWLPDCSSTHTRPLPMIRSIRGEKTGEWW